MSNYCPRCGSQSPDDATRCGVCGAALTNPYQAPSTRSGLQGTINNYLIPAIFATACCCFPFGIVSIVYAAQVNGLLARGDVEGAQKAAGSAKMWFWIAIGLGIGVQVIYLGFTVLSILAGVGAPPPRRF